MAERLERYRDKRDFARTSEPKGSVQGAAQHPRFVVQEHHATRLHWDLRLEHDGVLASWAIPNGIPPTPKENRLAVRTEDHPLQYLTFAGEIPKGEYGAGTMSIWDTGTYETHKFDADKVEVTFSGERLHGRYGLFPIGRRADGGGSENDWMIHRMDPPGPTAAGGEREPMPERLVPMLAEAGRPPADGSGWSYEVKWDGVRAIAYCKPGRLRLESRNLNEITDSYPEVKAILGDLGMRELVLDGELVAFDDDGKPSFERLQRRMHVTSPNAVRRLSSSTPVVYAIFDLLYLDGEILTGLAYDRRRERLEALGIGGPAWRVPGAHAGDEAGRRLLAATKAQGLEGVVAKRLDSRYVPGRRTGAWVKIKHLRRQELVIGGWLPGEGRRAARIGALLMGYHRDGELRYAGRVGTGFTERTLTELTRLLEPLRTETAPFEDPPKLPRNAQFVAPELVAEIEFREWTGDGVMRAPSFKGLRDDIPAVQVVREPVADEPESVADAEPGPDHARPDPEDLFDEVVRRPDGALGVTVDGRPLRLTNWDKVLYPQTGFTKGDLIAYYARIAPVLVAHLRDRPLTLKRYPNGVDAPYFYEKQSPSHRPEWVQTVRVSGRRVHARAGSRDAGLAREPRRHRAAHVAVAARSRAAPDDARVRPRSGRGRRPAGVLRGGARPARPVRTASSCAASSRPRARRGCRCTSRSTRRSPTSRPSHLRRPSPSCSSSGCRELVVSRMTKRLRPGRVLVDWSQNDRHKTTVNVYSVRARPTPTISTPVGWDEVRRCRDDRDPAQLSFGPDDVRRRVAADGDLFAPLLSASQQLPQV